MEIFEIVFGIASILSLIVSLFVAKKVYNISTKVDIAIDTYNKSSISQKLTGVGKNIQSGRDTIGK